MFTLFIPNSLNADDQHEQTLHQRVADSSQTFQCFFLLSQPDPSRVMANQLMGCPIKMSRRSCKGENYLKLALSE